MALKFLRFGLAFSSLVAALGGCATTQTQSAKSSDASRGLQPLDPSSIDYKIGQMMVMGFRGKEGGDDTVKKVLNYTFNGYLGGIVLFRDNIDTADQLRSLVLLLKTANPKLLVAVDQEGGLVQRLSPKKGFTGAPSEADVAKGTISQAREIYDAQAQQLADFGISMNFAPVVDMNDPAKPGPVIGKLGRSFGDNPDVVIQYSEAFIAAHHKHGILTSIKHFPGHGLAQGDTHDTITDITQVDQAAKKRELSIFHRLIQGGHVDTVMTAHILDKNYDQKLPATLSPVIITKLLREQGNYDGVVVTDDLHMGAILKNYGLRSAIVQAIQAGGDLLVFSNNPAAAQGVPDFSPDEDLPFKFLEIVKDAIAKNEITADRIEQSFRRITALKSKKF